jgi:soluble lytic murein transglycosylase-like protein
MTNLWDAFIENEAKEFNLDPLWIKAIIQQESGGNPYALRYEPTFSYFVDSSHLASILGISQDTEHVTQAMSWGLSQMMGGLLRQIGFRGYMGAMFVPETSILWTTTYLASLARISSVPSDLFAMWNGGQGARVKENGLYRNQQYVNETLAILQKFKGES